MNSKVKIIITILVTLFGLSGLLMTLCGGVFTAMVIGQSNREILWLSIGYIVAGLFSMRGA